MRDRLTNAGQVRVQIAKHRELIKHYDAAGKPEQSGQHFAEFCRLNRALRDMGERATP